MKTSPFALDNVQIASPCSANWDEMQGTDQKRFCQHCKLNVYNLSEMTRDAAVELIREQEGHLCVRLYRRQDGTVLTRDCPVGLRALRRRLAAMIAGTASLLIALTAGTLFGKTWIQRNNGVKAGQPGGDGPVSRMVEWINPPNTTPVGGAIIMGGMCAPPAMTTPPVPGQLPGGTPAVEGDVFNVLPEADAAQAELR